jgi:hypothetical protein
MASGHSSTTDRSATLFRLLDLRAAGSPGRVSGPPDQASGLRLVLKAQVAEGGRGKRGLVRRATLEGLGKHLMPRARWPSACRPRW